MAKRGAGDLKDRIVLQRRGTDDNGDPLGPWAVVPSGSADGGWSAQIVRLKGGEQVMAQRLQGSRPVLIAVRANTATRQADTAWRAVDRRGGQIYEFTDVAETDDRAWVEILATAKAGDVAVI